MHEHNVHNDDNPPYDHHDVVVRHSYVEKTAVERHIQTAMAVVLLGVLGWVGLAVTEQQKSMARMEVQAATLKEAVQDVKVSLRAATADRYTAQEAERAHARCQDRMNLLEQRMGDLQRQYRDHNEDTKDARNR